MDNKLKLIWIKVIHSIIWIFYNLIIWNLLYLSFIGNFNFLFYICLFFLFLEGLVLFINHWECPLTTIAKKYSNSNKPNFDIYLPEVIARYNKEIYTLIIILGFFVVLFKHIM